MQVRILTLDGKGKGLFARIRDLFKSSKRLPDLNEVTL